MKTKNSLYQYEMELMTPQGNNIFSYEQRKQKSIFVPPLIEGNILDLQESDFPAFIEIDENNVEQQERGLRNFIRSGNMFLFDNHNHSYYFYKKLLRENNLKSLDFVHVDQHKDLRVPALWIADYIKSIENIAIEFEKLGLGTQEIKVIESSFSMESSFLEEAADFLYSNLVLNVGNFIKPLVQEEKINKLWIVDSQYAMEDINNSPPKNPFILDLDLDFFSKDMDYIDYDKRLKFVQSLVSKASGVLIATSPYFMTFQESKSVLKEIFN